MCLIAYVPAGKQMPDDYITAAAAGNDDGIGVMSSRGVAKFVGKKMLKRARKYLRLLHSANQEFAVHFRYATHGEVGMANTHPFALPNGAGWLMHNGILSDFTFYSTDKMSDTAIFTSLLFDAADYDVDTWQEDIGKQIGFGNKLCVMTKDHEFIIVNEDAGEWIGGIWYSQTYSLPITKTLAQYARHTYGSYYRTEYGEVDATRKVAEPKWLSWDKAEQRMRYTDRFGFIPDALLESAKAEAKEAAKLPYEVKSAARALTARATIVDKSPSDRAADMGYDPSEKAPGPWDNWSGERINPVIAREALAREWERLEAEEADRQAELLAKQMGTTLEDARTMLETELGDGMMLPSWSQSMR